MGKKGLPGAREYLQLWSSLFASIPAAILELFLAVFSNGWSAGLVIVGSVVGATTCSLPGKASGEALTVLGAIQGLLSSFIASINSILGTVVGGFGVMCTSLTSSNQQTCTPGFLGHQTCFSTNPLSYLGQVFSHAFCQFWDLLKSTLSVPGVPSLEPAGLASVTCVQYEGMFSETGLVLAQSLPGLGRFLHDYAFLVSTLVICCTAVVALLHFFDWESKNMDENARLVREQLLDPAFCLVLVGWSGSHFEPYGKRLLEHLGKHSRAFVRRRITHAAFVQKRTAARHVGFLLVAGVPVACLASWGLVMFAAWVLGLLGDWTLDTAGGASPSMRKACAILCIPYVLAFFGFCIRLHKIVGALAKPLRCAGNLVYASGLFLLAPWAVVSEQVVDVAIRCVSVVVPSL